MVVRRANSLRTLRIRLSSGAPADFAVFRQAVPGSSGTATKKTAQLIEITIRHLDDADVSLLGHDSAVVRLRNAA
jgi:hypothetical protein